MPESAVWPASSGAGSSKFGKDALSKPDPYARLANDLQPFIESFQTACSELRDVANKAHQEAILTPPLALVKRPIASGTLVDDFAKHFGLHIGMGVMVELFEAERDVTTPAYSGELVYTALAASAAPSVSASTPQFLKHVKEQLDKLQPEECLSRLCSVAGILRFFDMVTRSTVQLLRKLYQVVAQAMQDWRNEGIFDKYYTVRSTTFQTTILGHMLATTKDLLASEAMMHLALVTEAATQAIRLKENKTRADEVLGDNGIICFRHIYAFSRPRRQEQEEVPPLDPDLVIIQPPANKILPHSTVLSMVSRVLGRTKYKLGTQNCEHIANFLATGELRSDQVQDVGAGIGGLIGGGLAMLAGPVGILGALAAGAATLLGVNIGRSLAGNGQLPVELQHLLKKCSKKGPTKHYQCEAERMIIGQLVEWLEQNEKQMGHG